MGGDTHNPASPPALCRNGHASERYADGVCKQCARESAARWQRNHPEKARERNRKVSKAKQSEYGRRSRAKNWRTQHRKRGVKGYIPDPPIDNRCESCGEVPRRRLHCDHVHETGAFRGWLCGLCNTGLGHMRDSIERLEKLITYMRSRGY